MTDTLAKLERLWPAPDGCAWEEAIPGFALKRPLADGVSIVLASVSRKYALCLVDGEDPVALANENARMRRLFWDIYEYSTDPSACDWAKEGLGEVDPPMETDETP